MVLRSYQFLFFLFLDGDGNRRFLKCISYRCLRNFSQQCLWMKMYWSWGIRVTDYHQVPNPWRVAPTVLSGEEAATGGGTLPSHDLPEQRCRQVRLHPGLFIEKTHSTVDTQSLWGFECGYQWWCPQERKSKEGISYTSIEEIVETHTWRRF